MFRLRQTDNAMQQLLYVSCNSCGKETMFQGVYCPISCRHCDELLPDALDLHYSGVERIVYHQDEEIFE